MCLRSLCDALHLRLLGTVGLPIAFFMMLKCHAKIAAEAGIGRRRCERKRLAREKAVQPLNKLLLALHIGFSNLLDVKLEEV